MKICIGFCYALNPMYKTLVFIIIKVRNIFAFSYISWKKERMQFQYSEDKPCL